MYLLGSFVAWFVLTYWLLGGDDEPVAGASFTLLYFAFFGVWGMVWIYVSELVTRKLAVAWPHLMYLGLVGLLYVFVRLLMGELPIEISYPFLPMVGLYFVKLTRRAGHLSKGTS